jgi:hypothetical protein
MATTIDMTEKILREIQHQLKDALASASRDRELAHRPMTRIDQFEARLDSIAADLRIRQLRRLISNMPTEIVDELQDVVSFERTTNINTLFISPHAIRVAIDPPDGLDPRVARHLGHNHGDIVAGEIRQSLLQQSTEFIARNREMLIRYWNYEIDTKQLQQGLNRFEMTNIWNLLHTWACTSFR